MKGGIEITGLDDVQNLLQKVAPNHARNISRATVHAVAKDLRDEVRSEAPTDGPPRVLKSQIRHARKRSKPGTVLSVVTINRRAFYWRFLEYGTRHITERKFISKAVDKIQPLLMPLYLRAFGAKFDAAIARAQKRQAKR